ncbi:MAG: hypothetical protein LBS31_05045 [Candidatus Adiutrix sp.]|jgi:penicillin-binding protein 2|nr:hypothetical protein [Candidatus Adiutrix sp.]
MTNGAQPFSENNKTLSGRYYMMFWGMVFFFILLGGRLWHLQVIRGEELHGKAESNRTEMVELSPVRGLILDRDGAVLMANLPSFDLCVEKSKVSDPEALVAELAALTGRNLEELKKKYSELPRMRYVGLPLIYGLSREELVAVETRRFRLDGVSIRVSSARRAVHDVFASHALGYLGEISQKQLDSERARLEEKANSRTAPGGRRRGWAAGRYKK